LEQLSFFDLYDIPVLQAFINSLSNTLHVNLCFGGLHGEAFIKATAFSDEREPGCGYPNHDWRSTSRQSFGPFS